MAHPLLFAVMISLAAVPLFAQEPRENHLPPVSPDVELVTKVRARELRFERVPQVDVTVYGSVNGVEGTTVSETDRHNLPEQVEPNVTYRDTGIVLTITSTLPDIEKILDEVLGAASRIPPAESDDAREAGSRRSP